MTVLPEEDRSEQIRDQMAEAGASPAALLAYDGISSLLLDILNELRGLKDLTAEIVDDA